MLLFIYRSDRTVHRMSLFTAHDRANLRLLAGQHKAIQRRNALLERAPHVGTHTVLRVRACTDEYDCHDPIRSPPADADQRAARLDLEDLAIAVDWKFTGIGCETISCNPFYPKSRRCRGMATSVSAKDDAVVEQRPPPFDRVPPREHAFSFRTASGQSFDACQPACYDPHFGRNNMVGLTSRYAFDKCRVYDPLVMAFYLDPSRRYVNPDTQILERQAYAVRDALIEPYGDAALLASIPADYCDQYAESYEPDGREHGIDMYKCGEHAVVWSTSWLVGDSLPRLALLSYDKLFDDKDVLNHEETRLPPSRDFMSSLTAWRGHLSSGKHRLPFPLRLSDLGIRRGTPTERLVWTDEFAHLTDGRNDAYGGRLVERERPIANAALHGLRDRTAAAAAAAVHRSMTAGGRFGGFAGVATKRDGRQTDGVVFTGTDADLFDYRSAMLKSLELGASEYNRILGEEIDRDGEGFTDALVGAGAGLTYGLAYGYLAHKLEWPTATGALKGAFNALRRAPSYARSAPVKTVGFWAAESAAAHAVESLATRTVVNRVKTLAMVQALGPIALVVDVIALIGMAVDITFVLLNAFGVSTPLSRRENFVSDRRLYRLAQAEIEFNRRMYGVGNIELTPYQYVVNTPYLTAAEDMEAHMILLPIVYAARRYNNDGGLLRPTVEEDSFAVDEHGTVHYSANGVRDEERVFSEADRIQQPVPTTSSYSHGGGGATDVGHYRHHYYLIVLFITVFLVAYFYPNRRWTIAVAFLVSVLTVVFHRGGVTAIDRLTSK